ncbi:MAG: trehalose-phosphatase [Candidatus Omnitrophota bacterium]|nr:trehalose-phosphatase [Candidatus Omnitrophota bacterium]
MKYLFADWRELSKKFASTKKVILLTDYDGTLTPIVKHPGEAALSRNTKNLLRSISKKRRVKLGVLSGRSISDIKKLVGLKNIIYSGNHGFEIETKRKLFLHPHAKKARPALKQIYHSLSRRFSGDRQVIIEDKRATVALHYRLAKGPKKVRQLKKIFRDITRPYVKDKKVRLKYGKKVLEAWPFSRVDKGWALKWIMNKLAVRKTLMIYLGDDRTDEDAFKAMGRRGISVFVGSEKKRSKAGYFLKDTGEVKEFLKRLNLSFPDLIGQ